MNELKSSTETNLIGNYVNATNSIFPDFVTNQKKLLPSIYSKIDFTRTPERFTTASDVQTEMPREFLDQRERLLADQEKVTLIRNYTMVGDRTADAFVSLIPEYGFRRLIGMLETAIVEGVEAVNDAPPELVDFITELEMIPDWIDVDLAEEGARQERNYYVHLAPYIIRGGLLATFMNKYAALPMAITGGFSKTTSARRVFETGSFFAATIMPRGMRRHSGGFLAAAKVRLMHSMVRFNIMRTDRWDANVYGVPIPQVDQMPAGMFGMYLLALDVLRSGRTEFNQKERARVEMYRYRCYLLGLPEALLETTPQGIFDIWMTLLATQRAGYDDATCGELLRSTMEANLSKDKSLKGRIHSWMERGFSKMFFVQNFLDNDTERAAAIGVKVRGTDKLAAIAAAIWAYGHIYVFELLDNSSTLRDRADSHLVRRMQALLESYGHADFVTDAGQYQHSGTS